MKSISPPLISLKRVTAYALALTTSLLQASALDAPISHPHCAQILLELAPQYSVKKKQVEGIVSSEIKDSLLLAKLLRRVDQNLHEKEQIKSLEKDLPHGHKGLWQKSTNQVAIWLQTIGHVGKSSEAKKYFKNLYLENSIIQTKNIPQAYKSQTEQIIADQKESLSPWVDYVFSSDADYIPPWAKTWVLMNVSTLATPDGELEKGFKTRDKHTLALFPELNQEALAQVVEDLKNHLATGQTVRRRDTPSTCGRCQLPL